MTSQDRNTDQRLPPAIELIAAVLLSIGLALGVGMHAAHAGTNAALPAPVTSAAPVTQPSAQGIDRARAPATGGISAGEASSVTPAVFLDVGDSSRVAVENGVVKIYFATGKSELPADALKALAHAIAAAQVGKGLIISAFHDENGDASLNAELATQRAQSVRDALVSAGVPPASMELRKPEPSTSMRTNADTRRVEVTVVE